MGVGKNVINYARGIPDWRTNDPDGEEKQLPRLFRTKKGMYIRILYALIEDTFNRPIASEPNDWIDCIIREHDPNYKGFFPKLLLTDQTKRCLNLGSYNYLGFGGVDKYPNARQILEDAVTKYPLSTASPSAELGYHPVHAKLEARLADYLNKEDAMVIGMGFATNSTVLPALVGKGDLIVSDELNHTSIVQGARESGAKVKPFMHNDAADLERVLQDAVMGPKKYGKILLVIEGIYSMEGDICDLKNIVPIAKRYGAYIYLDEAHSIGAVGPTGRGVTEELGIGTKDIDIMMGTFSKSFGSSGGYVAGKKHVVDHVRRFAAGATDAASMPPACAIQIMEALKLIMGAAKDPNGIGAQKLRAINENARFFRRRLVELGFEVLGQAPSPVIPVMLYTPTKIGDFSRYCFRRGLAVVTVGAPAVPLMYGRVRFCISAAHKKEDLVRALEIISEIGDELQVKYRAKHAPNKSFPGTLDSLEHEREVKKQARAKKVAALREKALKARAKITWNPLISETKKSVNPFGWSDRKKVGQAKISVSSWDYLGLSTDPSVQSQCVRTLEKKGLGSCGPRGFYGTYPEHLRAERDIAAFLETDQAVLYPFGACTVSSVIACMAAREDVLIVDEGVGRNVLTGVNLTRAEVRFYKHCDAADCERVLKDIAADEWKGLGGSMGFSPRRKFIISESVFGSTGKLAPVDKLCELRLQYKTRFILDESHSFGVLGATGRGATEHFGLKSSDVDVICGSLEGLASCCGFSAGATGVVSYQRLLGSGYCFSASPPPYLATAVSASLVAIRKSGPARMRTLRTATQKLREGLEGMPELEVTGSKASPMFSVGIRQLKDDEAAELLDSVCAKAQARGLAVCRFNRPPLTFKPKNFSLSPALRICGSSVHTQQDIQFALEVLTSAFKQALTGLKLKESKFHVDVVESPSPAKAAPVDHDDYAPAKKTKLKNKETYTVIKMPFLVVLWTLVSLSRRYLTEQSEITSRFIDGWLRMLRLDRNSTSQAVQTFYCLASIIGSHHTYSMVLPMVFWSFGGSPKSAIPYIFYCLNCAAGCMMKCAIREEKDALSHSWPSITAMNAIALPFFFLRYYYGHAWLYHSFTVQNLCIGFAGVVWFLIISLSRMQKGDSPSNVSGGLVAGCVAIHVMLLFCSPTVAWLLGSSTSSLCPPLWFALCSLLFFPLPESAQVFSLHYYGHVVKHMVSMTAFMYGASWYTSSAAVAEPVAMLQRGAIGVVLHIVIQLLATFLIRKMLAVSLACICANVRSMRKYAVQVYQSAEILLPALVHGLTMSTLVPAILDMAS